MNWNKRISQWKKTAVAVMALVLLTAGGSPAAEVGPVYIGADMSDTKHDGSTITTTADAHPTLVGHAFGIYTNTSSGADTRETKIGNNWTITTKGQAADGIRSNPGGALDWKKAGGIIRAGDGLTILTYGQGADGINLNGYTKAFIGNHATIKTYASGDAKYSDGRPTEAAIAVRANYASEITIGSGLIAETQGNEAYGLWAAQGNYAWTDIGGSKIYVGDGAAVTTHGKEAHAIYVESRSGVVEIGKNSNIATNGAKAYAAYVTRAKGKLQIGEGSTLRTTSDDSHVLYLSGSNAAAGVGDGTALSSQGASSHGVYTTSDTARTEFKGGAAIAVSGADSYALYAKAGTAASAPGAGGLFAVSGDMKTDAKGVIDLTMTDGSLFSGKTSAGGGTISLDMTGAQWNVTGNSDLTALKLDGTTVDLSGAALGTVLKTGELAAGTAGAGTFVLKTDITGGTGDLISADKTSGTHKLLVQDQSSAAADGSETLTVVETGDGKATFDLSNEVSVGAWLYGLRRTAANENNWELYSTQKSNPTANAAVSTFSGAYLLAYAETQTLMQRLGDLRDTPFLSGFWFRVYGGKFESNSSSFVRGFDMDYGGVQLGYDRKIENNWKGDTYIGGFFGYGKGDLDYNTKYGNTGGSGTVDSKTVGAYATYVQDDGFYADAVVKYMWMKNKFDVLDTNGTHVTGSDLSTGGLGISLELGKRFRFSQNEKGGNWYVEPQVQYSYTHQDGGYYNASNGLRIGVDSFTSSLGRLGVLVGYETEKTNFYAKASYVKEFDGDINILANGVGIPESFGDSWWVYGIGLTSRLNERNSVYMSLERSNGGKFDEPWKVYGGWRIAF